MMAPLARIGARYLSAALVTYGLATPADVAILHPELVALVGGALAAVTEGVYVAAKRKGWTT